ncbi:MAG TPA: NADH-quinone oxidoreductase subunit K [Anaeromyxobacteraceae bacterium]|nr:NADH-quinone oxidoreductase subunit K [Anaeromyxobacteraceae bacterium]
MTAGYWIEHYRAVASAAGILFVAGLYCILFSRNLLRILLGTELLTKSVTLLLVLAGAVTGRVALAEAMVITVVVLEVVAVAVAAGLVVGVFRHHGATRVRLLTDLKG